MTNKAWIKTKNAGDTLFIYLGGLWKAIYIKEAESGLQALDFSQVKKCVVNFTDIKAIDTTGAWAVKSFLNQFELGNIPFSFVGESQALINLWPQLEKSTIPAIETGHKQNPLGPWLADLGRKTTAILEDIVDIVAFLGRVVIAIGHDFKNPNRIRFTSLIVFLERSGLQALPIIGIISFLLGIVLVHQGAFQLSRFGAEIYAVDLLAISMLREIGILLTAIMVAGRSGSSFAAQIGTMKLNQEISAMQTLGLDPVEILVLPRLFSLMIALPLLAFYSDIMGLLGGAFMATFAIGLSLDQFIMQLGQSVSPWTFWIGIIKAPFFAFIIALIGCYEGMQVSEGAESVGLRTTQSVVKAIFLVIVCDAAFSVLFTYMGI